MCTDSSRQTTKDEKGECWEVGNAATIVAITDVKENAQDPPGNIWSMSEMIAYICLICEKPY